MLWLARGVSIRSTVPRVSVLTRRQHCRNSVSSCCKGRDVSAIASVLELSVPALDVAVADVEALIAKIKKAHPRHDPEDVREAFNLIADVTDELQRQVLQNRSIHWVARNLCLIIVGVCP
jgi:hypothetical protein